MGQIRIGLPYIVKNGDKVLLCADIEDESDKKRLYFETDIENIDYLNTENSDCFILALLHNAMFEGKDLVCDGLISERLLFQLRNYYVPIIANNMPELSNIKIIAEVYKGKIVSEGAIATGCSGGIDSFYTMLSYSKIEEKGFRLTHVIFNNISTADQNDERIRNLYERDLIEKKRIASELGLDPIAVYTNLYEFYKSQFVYNFYFASQYVCIPYVLNRLISTFYFSSGVSTRDFSLDRSKIKDGAFFDLFSLSCFSTDSMRLYSAGAEVDRMEKTKTIAENSCAQKHLQVCSEEQYPHFYVHNKVGSLNFLNCGKCGKCLRTISALYSIGKLEEFRGVFDMSLFDKNPSRFIGHELAHDLKLFTLPLVRQLREKGLYKSSITLWKYFWKVYEPLWYVLRQNSVLRRIYRKVKYK